MEDYKDIELTCTKELIYYDTLQVCELTDNNDNKYICTYFGYNEYYVFPLEQPIILNTTIDRVMTYCPPIPEQMLPDKELYIEV